jgi:hypothetical protein
MRKSFTSVFGRDVPPSYLDLGSLVEVINQVTNDRRPGACLEPGARLRWVRGSDRGKAWRRRKPGATGISIYFPEFATLSLTVGRRCLL